ncbi:hypothetical protein GCM10022243_13500 [Saccharothrix violaceirubra]|uniref:DUF397 domain-containing protein n=1 Tax=Saccharothrix violaceirubra TaxID=413306 RepID=A0A7W7WTT9_9PSEU|nr:DUF397 domain-containing protein [Saccharothrix violaceirubra]MBB4963530.1 hypothetical protein [Saccharothrix violaceirubra]
MSDTWTWRKSSRSVGNGDCVEVGTSVDAAAIGVRDSKRGDSGPVLLFSHDGIATFFASAKAGKFDH